MTPEQIKAARRALSLSVEGFAHAVGATGRSVRRWEDGTRDVPGPVLRLLELAELSPAVRSWLIAKGKGG